jgi:hypothetical protein
MSRDVSVRELEEYHERFQQLYAVENKPLKEAMGIFHDKYGIRATYASTYWLSNECL